MASSNSIKHAVVLHGDPLSPHSITEQYSSYSNSLLRSCIYNWGSITIRLAFLITYTIRNQWTQQWQRRELQMPMYVYACMHARTHPRTHTDTPTPTHTYFPPPTHTHIGTPVKSIPCQPNTRASVQQNGSLSKYMASHSCQQRRRSDNLLHPSDQIAPHLLIPKKIPCNMACTHTNHVPIYCIGYSLFQQQHLQFLVVSPTK